MKMQNKGLSILLLFAASIIVEVDGLHDSSGDPSNTRQGPFYDLQKLVTSELSDHLYDASEKEDSDEIDSIWNSTIDHAWLMTEKLSKQLSLAPKGEQPFPFLVCSQSKLLKSGVERLKPMLKATKAMGNDHALVQNSRGQTCHIITTNPSIAKNVNDRFEDISLIPLADRMKIASHT